VIPVRYSLLRDLIAFVIVVIACPIAVFGGANLGCVGSSSFTGGCAVTVIFVSPLILMLGGAIAGVASRGWTGLMIVLIGTFFGMVLILVISVIAGKPVPVDLFSGIVATVFFGAPLAIGYGIGRVLWRLFDTRDGGGAATR
jgi:hypothetical protein